MTYHESLSAHAYRSALSKLLERRYHRTCPGSITLAMQHMLFKTSTVMPVEKTTGSVYTCTGLAINSSEAHTFLLG